VPPLICVKGVAVQPPQHRRMADDPQQLVFGERSLTKVAGIYRSRESADAARSRLLEVGWPASHAVLLTPDDGRRARRDLLARKVEPEPRGIWKTIVRAHVVAGAVGLAVGVGTWAALLAAGNVLVSSAPVASGAAIVFIATAFGGMAGGLIALRPDHAQLITALRSALREGRFAVVAHPTDEAQAAAAEAALRSGADHVERTL
jgi:hypothetical protein